MNDESQRDRSRRRRTSTSEFGVGAREGHDSSAFYERFRPPTISDDTTIAGVIDIDEPFVCGDARDMSALPDASVALVVTSPPYFAGKQYETELEREGIPASYLDYLDMLTEVFTECRRVLEPGGRIAVNVANLGRRPYRSLAADVIRILGDDLGLLLRGELVWRKGEGATGSCAWGSFKSAANPVLRDLTERIVVASKGRFDRALDARRRADAGLPHRSTMRAEDFMGLTLDLWSIPTESATRVGHPAPFPVELPEQLIRLYTYEDDLVLDPFMGSGSSLVAAARLGRRYVGYDLDPEYVALARERVGRVHTAEPLKSEPLPLALTEALDHTAPRLTEVALDTAGFTVIARDRRLRGTGVTIPIIATDRQGGEWYVDVAGANTTVRGGLARTDTIWRTLARAAAVRETRGTIPWLVVSPAPPPDHGDATMALRAGGPSLIFDVIDLSSPAALERLARYGTAGSSGGPSPGFWRTRELDV